MNRTTRTVIRFLAIIIATFVCIALAYFSVSSLFGGQLANASGGITRQAWEDKYISVVIMTGTLTGICSLIWFVLSTFVFKVEYAQGVGKRTVWVILAFVALVISIAVPMVYSTYISIHLNLLTIALFVIFFACINYWLTTIFATPLAFKYTPIGAKTFLSHGRK